MSEPRRETRGRRPSLLWSGTATQKARLLSGLVLVLFVTTHLLNNAAGLFGIELMDRLQTLRFAVTRSLPGGLVLVTASMVHMVLGLVRISERRTARMPTWEAVQIGTGLLIPLLLIDHVVGTRGASLLFGVSDYYRPVLALLWPEHAIRQTLLVLIVWTHACIGVRHWLGMAPWFPRAAPWLLAVAVLIPALALAGFVAAGREVAEMTATPEARNQLMTDFHFPSPASLAQLALVSTAMQLAFAAALALALGRIAARLVMDGRRPMVPITYTAGPVVSGTVGATLLEMSRAAGVPHASICGGRARCSTCRVRVVDGLASLPPPEFAEPVTLGTIGAPDNVRLACQIRPTAPLTVTRLVGVATAAGRIANGASGEDRGVERRLAVMFLDIRGFTALAEHRLPYDVVFLLNSFYARIGAAIADEGGWIDKYMGDGLLAVFGRDTGGTEGARSALNAAVAIDRALDILEDDLAGEGYRHLGVGIGLHYGPLVLGHIGYGEAARMTVIGATVNLASRLEGATRERNCQLIVSRALAAEAGWDGDGGRHEAITVRGPDVPVEVFVVGRARDMRLDTMPASPPDDLPRTAGA